MWDISPNFKVLEVQPDGDSWSNSIRYEDASGNVFWDYDDEDSHHSLYYDPEGTTGLFGWLPDRWQEYGPGTD